MAGPLGAAAATAHRPPPWSPQTARALFVAALFATKVLNVATASKTINLVGDTGTIKLPPAAGAKLDASAAGGLLSASEVPQNYNAIAAYRLLKDAMRSHHDAKYGGKLLLPSETAIAEMVSLAASPDGPAQGVVGACADDATLLCVDGKLFFFGGTNLYVVGGKREGGVRAGCPQPNDPPKPVGRYQRQKPATHSISTATNLQVLSGPVGRQNWQRVAGGLVAAAAGKSRREGDIPL